MVGVGTSMPTFDAETAELLSFVIVLVSVTKFWFMLVISCSCC